MGTLRIEKGKGVEAGEVFLYLGERYGGKKSLLCPWTSLSKICGAWAMCPLKNSFQVRLSKGMQSSGRRTTQPRGSKCAL